MKKLFSILLCLCFFGILGGCLTQHTVKVDGDFTVIEVVGFTQENTTLLEYMNGLKGQNKLDFSIENDMITSINGKFATKGKYWMLYTDDLDNSNSAWGTCEYNNKIYNSASMGAEILTVKNDCTYIWYLQQF